MKKSQTKIVAYPAVFDTSENTGGYTIYFPDITGAISESGDIPTGLLNAADALGLSLYDEDKLPVASSLAETKASFPDAFVSLIAVDLVEFAKHVTFPFVKKNTRIPADLAKKAEELDINFSATLTEALTAKIAKAN